MANSPSHRWEGGTLMERAISTIHDEDAEAEEVEPKATRPYKTPVPTKSAANRKQISAEADTVEDKAVSKKKAAKK